jgi:hypothetical protein
MEKIYQKKYLKYKKKYLNFLNQIGGRPFNINFLNAGTNMTDAEFIIDAYIYDENYPVDLQPRHHDKSNKYVATITFAYNNDKYFLRWNLEPKVINKEQFHILQKYKSDNEETIITTAITKFKETYKHLRPDKSWR